MSSPITAPINLPLIHRGKVRDIFAVDESHMLIVTTDRLSAFDVVFDCLINNKGKILTSLSNYWFNKTQNIIPNHLTKITLEEVLAEKEATIYKERAIIVKKLKPIKIEAIVRGYLTGSGWKEYQKTGLVSGIQMQKNLQLSAKLPEPIYTPSSKAAVGSHDVNISFKETKNILGDEMANKIKVVSLSIYKFAAEYAIKKGIIIADTKFEFGVDENGNLTIMDEMLTPDSSRFWEKASYKAGQPPKSYDKQIIRDYLESLIWDKRPPAPNIPKSILTKTSMRYQQIESILCS